MTIKSSYTCQKLKTKPYQINLHWQTGFCVILFSPFLHIDSTNKMFSTMRVVNELHYIFQLHSPSDRQNAFDVEHFG